MNKLEMKGDWSMVKGRLKQRFAKLTDNDLRYTQGQEDELLGRIQKRLGETREKVERLLRECGKESSRVAKTGPSGRTTLTTARDERT